MFNYMKGYITHCMMMFYIINVNYIMMFYIINVNYMMMFNIVNVNLRQRHPLYYDILYYKC